MTVTKYRENTAGHSYLSVEIEHNTIYQIKNFSRLIFTCTWFSIRAHPWGKIGHLLSFSPAGAIFESYHQDVLIILNLHTQKKGALLHFRTPLRVRVRATVKLLAAFFHDESSITIRGVRKCNSAEESSFSFIMKKIRREDIATVPSYIHLLKSKFFYCKTLLNQSSYSVFHKLSNKEILVIL